jgi:hypothetical protein
MLRIVSPLSGRVLLGVNDSDPANNDGVLNIEAFIYNARAADWAQPGRILPCPPAIVGAR